MNTGNEQAFEFRKVACSACGADNPKLLGYRGGSAHHGGNGLRTAIVRCGDCSHLYPNPMPFPAQGLDNLYTDPENYFSNHDVEKGKRIGLELMHEFESVLGRQGRFLDVGCGRGEKLWAARESGWEYEGVDASSAYLEWGRTKLGVTGRLATLEEAKYPDSTFDAVSMAGLVEHLYDPYSTLCEVRRVLRPGGVLWFNAPNEDGLYTQIGNLYMRSLRRDWVVNLAPTFSPFHVQGFNPRSLRTLLKRVNFTVERFRVRGEMYPQTGNPSVRKRLEYGAAILVNWVGNRCGAGIYIDVWAKKSE